MSTEPILEIKNISKTYRITHQRGGYISLREVLMNVLRKPFSFVKQKAASAVGLASKENFWALRDVSFNVHKGEVVGIIGRNGAGKSTLLKILSQITEPSEGEIIMRGSVGSLLEVGTGFHPELTGRENIFLNGAILGMPHAEIVRKFDAIVEFAGISQFLDTPVKRYSSGMYVRLAFSVAAHMEPDILLVDEVLAVGDAEFQKKCLGKMEEVTRKDGRTIIFVSHNLAAIQKLCSKCILLDHGQIVAAGKTEEVIQAYMFDKQSAERISIPEHEGNLGPLTIESVVVERNDTEHQAVAWDKPINVTITCTVREVVENIKFGLTLRTMDDLTVFTTRNTDHAQVSRLEPGTHTIRAEIRHSLRAGKYFFGMGIAQTQGKAYFNPYLTTVSLSEHGTDQKYIPENSGLIAVDSQWTMR